MTTFDQARQIARDTLGPTWQGPGVFFVAPWGYQDDADYLLIVGAAEYLVGDDLTYADISDVVVLVDKATGELVQSSYLDDPGRFDAMPPAGEPAPLSFD